VKKADDKPEGATPTVASKQPPVPSNKPAVEVKDRKVINPSKID